MHLTCHQTLLLLFFFFYRKSNPPCQKGHTFYKFKVLWGVCEGWWRERMVEKIWICRSGSLFLWRVWWHWCNLAKRDSKSDQPYWLLICKSIHNDNRQWPACYRYVFVLLSFGDFFSLCFSYELFHIWNCCMLYIYREDYPWKAWTFAEINIPHKEFCGNCMGWEEFQWEISYWTFPLFVDKSRALE